MAGQPRSSDPEQLKDAFKKAAEIASVVPEAMQDAAFHRALDQILKIGDDSEVGAPSARSSGGRTRRSKAAEETATDSARRLIEVINRTDYPEIASSTKVLDRSLAVLRLAK